MEKAKTFRLCDKSSMTGDCHARFRERRPMRSPRLLDKLARRANLHPHLKQVW